MKNRVNEFNCPLDVRYVLESINIEISEIISYCESENISHFKKVSELRLLKKNIAKHINP